MSGDFFSKFLYVLKYEGIFAYISKKRCIKKISSKVKMMSDREFIEKMYFCKMGRKINLDNPTTFNEKMQWLKLYWRDPLAEVCADKLLVRNYVAEKQLKEYLIPLYGVYNFPEEIDFNALPKKFVIKTTHDSGGVYIVRNNKVDYKKIFSSLNYKLKTNNQSLLLKEWVYENIEPKIIIEKLIQTRDEKNPKDYKFYCFHGEVKYILVVSDRGRKTRETYFDIDWNQMHFVNGVLMGEYIEKPRELEKMIKIAEILSEHFPHTRVDLYFENEQIYIGEITFFSASGTTNFYPCEYDELFGSYLDLTTIKNYKYIFKNTKNHCLNKKWQE